MSNVAFGYGFRRLLDAHQRFTRSTSATYLRRRNFPDIQQQEWAELGFSISPSGTAEVGTTDVLIDPPPSVTIVSLYNIGISGGKLRFGARQYLVSHTFAVAQMAARSLTNPRDVWKDSSVVGLYNDGMLFSIESAEHEYAAGAIISWLLTCNANEVK